MPLLEATYGSDRARLWLAYWRIFFMACEETFALDGGRLISWATTCSLAPERRDPRRPDGSHPSEPSFVLSDMAR
jgi:hypothetical protein